MKSNNIIVTEHRTADNKVIGQLTLHKEQALNALDFDMAKTMLAQLDDWSQRDEVVCVLINGSGPKAFCAGGDIVSMYHAMAAQNDNDIPEFVQRFFATEYQLDYTLHTYSVPVVVWGSGFVMGGGMGLLCGASHKVVTPSSRLAMPEITIGLYPDVGGSYFLPRMPGQLGKFLGLTGATIGAADACYVGLADVVCGQDSLAVLLEKLTKQHWASHNAHGVVSDALAQLTLEPDQYEPSKLAPWREEIDIACQSDITVDVVNNLLALSPGDDEFMHKSLKSLQHGCPLSAHLVMEQCRRGQQMSLADCFKMELVMSCICGVVGEFQEGVRALLIDKDKQPKWQYTHVNAVPDEVVARFFHSPFSHHPLATLGEQS